MSDNEIVWHFISRLRNLRAMQLSSIFNFRRIANLEVVVNILVTLTQRASLDPSLITREVIY